MHALTIKTLFFLSQFAVFFYMATTHPMEDAKLEIANGALGYGIVSKRIKKSKHNPNELVNLYREIEDGKFEGEKYPFRLMLQYQIQNSLFAAYEFEIRNNSAVAETLFKLWKEINRADKSNTALLSKEERETLRTMILAKFSITLERNINTRTRRRDAEKLLRLWKILGKINDDLLSGEELNKFKAQIKTRFPTVLERDIADRLIEWNSAQKLLRRWKILGKINDDLLSGEELNKFKAQIKTEFPTALGGDIREAKERKDIQELFELKKFIGNIKIEILSSTQKKEYLELIDEKNN